MTGQKRRAEDDLQDDQRFAKRFDLLNLESTGKLYLPVQKSLPDQRPRASHNDDDESMQVDETRDRVYIRNLDDELADVESEEEKLVFLPDIEKKLSRIPKSVLLGECHPSTGTEIVLYGVPASLSVPEEQDKVRKAIIESRARAREKQTHDAEVPQVNGEVHVGMVESLPQSSRASAHQFTDIEEDEDVMDIG